jgi:hypothetical protein
MADSASITKGIDETSEQLNSYWMIRSNLLTNSIQPSKLLKQRSIRDCIEGWGYLGEPSSSSNLRFFLASGNVFSSIGLNSWPPVIFYSFVGKI